MLCTSWIWRAIVLFSNWCTPAPLPDRVVSVPINKQCSSYIKQFNKHCELLQNSSISFYKTITHGLWPPTKRIKVNSNHLDHWLNLGIESIVNQNKLFQNLALGTSQWVLHIIHSFESFDYTYQLCPCMCSCKNTHRHTDTHIGQQCNTLNHTMAWIIKHTRQRISETSNNY